MQRPFSGQKTVATPCDVRQKHVAIGAPSNPLDQAKVGCLPLTESMPAHPYTAQQRKRQTRTVQSGFTSLSTTPRAAIVQLGRSGATRRLCEHGAKHQLCIFVWFVLFCIYFVFYRPGCWRCSTVLLQFRVPLCCLLRSFYQKDVVAARFEKSTDTGPKLARGEGKELLPLSPRLAKGIARSSLPLLRRGRSIRRDDTHTHTHIHTHTQNDQDAAKRKNTYLAHEGKGSQQGEQTLKWCLPDVQCLLATAQHGLALVLAFNVLATLPENVPEPAQRKNERQQQQDKERRDCGGERRTTGHASKQFNSNHTRTGAFRQQLQNKRGRHRAKQRGAAHEHCGPQAP